MATRTLKSCDVHTTKVGLVKFLKSCILIFKLYCLVLNVYSNKYGYYLAHFGPK